MRRFKSFLGGSYLNPRLLVCVALIGLFLWNASQFYLPGKGFTYLIEFGQLEHDRYLPEVRAINHYELEDSHGYDSQWYAQIAMDPHLRDKRLRPAVDSLPYRARRILFCWTAWALAGGAPTGALEVYAVQNIVCWLILALLLFRWFPPVNWGNVFRWAGVMFSFGLCISVRGALVDGPSLLLIALGMTLMELGWGWCSAILLGISGLGKETNVLAAAGLGPFPPRNRKEWGELILRGLIVILPLFVWLSFIDRWLGKGNDVGIRNFGPPFSSFIEKWINVITRAGSDTPDPFNKWSAVSLIALLTQALFFILVPRRDNPWWRIAIAYSVLMIFLGNAVWEGYPGAASRVLLPMMLCFNILVPRGRKWWVVLLLGNLTMLSSPDFLKPPGRESYTVSGPHDLRIVPESGKVVEAIYDQAWYAPEKSRFEIFRWSRGSANVVFRNPHPFPILITIRFGLRANDERTVFVSSAIAHPWTVPLKPAVLTPLVYKHLELKPGDSVIHFETDKPAIASETSLDPMPKKLAFSLRNLSLMIEGPAPVPVKP